MALVKRAFFIWYFMRFFFCFLFMLNVSNVFSEDKVIYGDDNRKDLYDVENLQFVEFAKSTLAMIPNTLIKPLSNSEVIIAGNTLAEESKVCLNERFAMQPTSSVCSGFLLGEDLLVTAGHCIVDQRDCDIHSWVLDYSYNTSKQLNQTAFILPSENVFQCKEIIARSQDPISLNDYAVIKLDRKSNRTPLKFRTEGAVSPNANLVVIGNPSGLPTKVSDNGYVRKNGNDFYFQTNLDSFSGNSGSAVIDANSGLVEGILVRGEVDYSYDRYNKCFRPKYCGNHLCRGEDVTRITNLKGIIF